MILVGMHTKMKHKAFTMIEVLLYTALAVIILSAVAVLMVLFLNSRIKNQTIAEVEQNGLQATQIMSQKIRNSNSIVSPAVNTQAASLTIKKQDTTNAVFALSGATLQDTENSTTTDLTSNRVAVSNLSFTNMSGAGTFGSVKISFTVTYLNPQNLQPYNYSKNFYTSASLR